MVRHQRDSTTLDRGLLILAAGAALTLACGDDSGRGDSDASTASASDTNAGSTTAGGGSETGSDTGSSQSGSDTNATSTSSTGGTDASTGAGTDDPGTTTSSSATGTTTQGVESETDTDSDTDTDTDTGEGCNGGGGGNLDFSYIWVANSAEGTASKINTVNMIEEGRYIVRPDSAGNPSRTSVNLRGDVAVANRAGGVSKIAARVEDCVDLNNNGVIDSSTGKFDVRPWGVEECVVWHAPLEQFNVMRPMAWSAGELNEQTCEYEGQLAWTTGAVANVNGSVVVLALDGDTGEIVNQIPVPELAVTWAGPYGGAVDANNDFWFHSRDAAPYPLVHVDAETLEYTIHNVPAPVNPYGITVDTSGRVWLAGYMGAIGRFNPADQSWATAPYTGLGIQEDAAGRMWIAKYPWQATGAWGLDVETMELIGEIDLTGTAVSSRGISIDFEGNVWVVEDGSRAFRVDIDNNNQWEVYEGLTGAYTYSDMTGWGLKNIIPE